MLGRRSVLRTAAIIVVALCVSAAITGVVVFVLLPGGSDDSMGDALPFLEDPRPATALVMVTGPDGLPRAAARVEAAPERYPLARRAFDPEPATPPIVVTTDGSGCADVAPLGPGDWRLVVTSPGCAPVGARVRGGGAARRLVRVRLPAAQTLRGRVVEPDGTPVAGAAVHTEHGAFATTDASGAFELADVAAGVAALLVRRPGDIDAPGGEFRVPQESPVTVVVSAQRAIRGRAVDATGAGVAGARVALALRSPGSSVVRADCGADGSFSIPVTTAAGEMGITILQAFGLAPGLACIGCGYGESALFVEGAAEVQVHFVPAGTVTGTVTGPSGPVAGAPVAVSEDLDVGTFHVYEWQYATTDSAGAFRFDSVAACRVGVRASAPAPGRELHWSTVHLAAGATVNVEVALPRDDVSRITLRGTVTAAGRPVDRASVSALGPGSSGPEEFAETSTAADGTFTLADVPADTGMSLVIAADGHRTLETQWMPASRHAAVFQYALEPGVRIEGTVEAPPGTVLRDARVWVGFATERGAFAAVWDEPAADRAVPVGADGRFATVWTGPPGELVVCAAAEGFAGGISDVVTVPEAHGAPLVANVALRQGVTLSGRLLDADGTPLPRYAVRLREPGRWDQRGVVVGETDESGRFTVPRLAAGQVVVVPDPVRGGGRRVVRVDPGAGEQDVQFRGPQRQSEDEDPDDTERR